MKPSVPELLDKLLTHGDANQIAAHLEQEEITGYRAEPDRCIIAEYVRAKAEAMTVTVMPARVDLMPSFGALPHLIPGHVGWILPDGTYGEVELPDELDRLANSFDRGDYPALVRHTPRGKQ